MHYLTPRGFSVAIAWIVLMRALSYMEIDTGQNMRQLPPPRHGQEDAASTEHRLATLLYRFLFFDWLFADMRKARNPFERHCAWRHNREMCRYLPTYLRRWAVLTILAFGLGCLFERLQVAILVAAWFFTCSGVMLSGMVVISVLWIFLSRPET